MIVPSNPWKAPARGTTEATEFVRKFHQASDEVLPFVSSKDGFSLWGAGARVGRAAV